MSTIKPLPPESLYQRVDPATLAFKTTAELAELTDVIGQPRATEAIQFGIGIVRDGYNLFVLGEPGTGKHSIVRRYLDERASQRPVASDWCYVNNFDEPHRPRALRLPPGRGVPFRQDMERFVEDLRSAIPGAFESEEYRARRHELEEELKERHEQAFSELGREAEAHDFVLVRTPTGMALAPTRKGEVISPAEFEKLPDEEQKRIGAVLETLQEQLEKIVHQLPQWRREAQQRLRDLDRDFVMSAVGHLIEELRKRYADLPDVLTHLEAVQEAVIEHADDFRRGEEGAEISFLGIPLPRAAAGAAQRRYGVNVLVDNSGAKGAPVVYTDEPSHPKLIGRVEHLAQMGALITDFTLIKAGALHLANGGYLILDARKLLMQPYAWEGLKRCLTARALRIESLGQMLSLISTVSLEPEPIPLDVKVVMLGDRFLYYLLYHYDPDFRELFKVAADFEETMDRSPEAQQLHARMLADMVRRDDLLPFDSEAVARVLEHGARQASDAQKLSLRMQDLVDLLRESDYWARSNQREVVSAPDVQRAIDTRVRRADRVREKVQEGIRRGMLLLDTAGEQIGQANALSVVSLGELDFGYPTRLTARVRMGKGEVLDIQREVELGGPIHSKGVMILAGFLGARFAADHPLALSATLVFEQTYGTVEGDSASCAELYALLSALAEVPIAQSLAITGSVNQHGEVQPIGGVNEKIEGFFDVCVQRGLTGKQGVLIPQANVQHLMLRHDVVDACRQGRFHIYPVTDVDQGIELLTGVPAGTRDSEGRFAEGSINARVEQRLLILAELARLFGTPPEEHSGPES